MDAEEFQNWEDAWGLAEDGFDLPVQDEVMAPDAILAQELDQEVNQEVPGRAIADLLLEYAHFTIQLGIPGEKYFHLLKRFLELAIVNLGCQELDRMAYDIDYIAMTTSLAVAQELHADEFGGRLIELIEFAWNSNQKHTYAAMLRRIIMESKRNLRQDELMALKDYVRGYRRGKLKKKQD